MSSDSGAPRYTVSDEGEFLRVRWASGVTVDANDARSRIATTNAMSPCGKRPLLIHIGLAKQITPEAKQLFVEDTSSTRLAILSEDEVGRVLTSFNHRSAIPSGYFNNELEAITWLTEKSAGEVDAVLPGTFSMELREDVLWVQWQSNTSVIEEDAAAVLKHANQLDPVGRRPMLMNVNQIILSQAALNLFAQKLNVVSLAFVGTADDDIIATHFRQHHRPSYPTKHFEAVDEAQVWLSHHSG
ncbi:hypothetical protein [Arthrobacter sp. B0490]|uniref:DUF7793 family protein n=1 Tax=Arthrobacter sp. B0490 TaxID=2058891 RepID=UPI0011AFF007|nr:hypothetical protein [Arthrobacter sp. B0490]